MGSTSQTSTKLGPHMYHQGVDLSFPKKWAWQLMSVARADPKNKQKCHKIQKVSTSNKKFQKGYQIPVCYTIFLNHLTFVLINMGEWACPPQRKGSLLLIYTKQNKDFHSAARMCSKTLFEVARAFLCLEIVGKNFFPEDSE